jgi:phage protein D
MPVSGQVRQPRAWLNVGGNNVRLTACTVYLNSYQQASLFTAEMALDDPTNPGAPFWAGQSGLITAEVVADNGDGSGQGVLITGSIDRASVNFRTRTVSVEGSDRTSEMIRTRSDEKFANQTPSEIVQTIAQRHGFTAHVDSTSDMAGKTFDFAEYAFNSSLQNDWDTLVALAEREGKVVYVIGNDLYFTTAGSAAGGSVNVSYTPPTPQSYAAGNFIELKCLIDYELATADSKVASWHTNKKAPVVGEQTITGGGGGAPGAGSVEFFDIRPGLTQGQATAQAQSTAKLAGAFQKQVEVDMPGDVNVTQSMTLTLSGTGTSWDQSYLIEAVTHRINAHQGYRMLIEAKNVDPGGAAYGLSVE